MELLRLSTALVLLGLRCTAHGSEYEDVYHWHQPHEHMPHQHMPHAHTPHSHTTAPASTLDRALCRAGSFGDGVRCQACPNGTAAMALQYPYAARLGAPNATAVVVPSRWLGVQTVRQLSVEAYFRRGVSAQAPPLMGLLSLGTVAEVAVSISVASGANSVEVELSVGGDRVVVDLPPIGEWVHLVSTIELSGRQRIYLNGVLTSSVMKRPFTPVFADTNYVGRARAAATQFLGEINDLVLYDGVVLAPRSSDGLRGLVGALTSDGYCEDCDGLSSSGVGCFGERKTTEANGGACPAGQEPRGSNGVCVSCLPGRFKAMPGREACKECPAGRAAGQIYSTFFEFGGGPRQRVRTCGGTSRAEPCTLPFEDQSGEQHDFCTVTAGRSRAWCATGEGSWGYCLCPGATTPASRGENPASEGMTLVNFGALRDVLRFSKLGKECARAICTAFSSSYISDEVPQWLTRFDVTGVSSRSSSSLTVDHSISVPSYEPPYWYEVGPYLCALSDGVRFDEVLDAMPAVFNSSFACVSQRFELPRLVRLRNDLSKPEPGESAQVPVPKTSSGGLLSSREDGVRRFWNNESGLEFNGARGTHVELPPFVIGGEATTLDVYVRPSTLQTTFNSRHRSSDEQNKFRITDHGHVVWSATTWRKRCAHPFDDNVGAACIDLNRRDGDSLVFLSSESSFTLADARDACESRGLALPSLELLSSLDSPNGPATSLDHAHLSFWTVDVCGASNLPRSTLFEAGNGERQDNVMLARVGAGGAAAELRVYVRQAATFSSFGGACRASVLLNEGRKCSWACGKAGGICAFCGSGSCCAQGKAGCVTTSELQLSGLASSAAAEGSDEKRHSDADPSEFVCVGAEHTLHPPWYNLLLQAERYEKREECIEACGCYRLLVEQVFEDGVWTHLVASAEASSESGILVLRLFKDGVLVGSATHQLPTSEPNRAIVPLRSVRRFRYVGRSIRDVSTSALACESVMPVIIHPSDEDLNVYPARSYRPAPGSRFCGSTSDCTLRFNRQLKRACAFADHGFTGAVRYLALSLHPSAVVASSSNPLQVATSLMGQIRPGSCEGCPAGRFQPSSGAAGACVPVSGDARAPLNVAASSQEKCPPCEAGFAPTSTSNRCSCKACLAGRYRGAGRAAHETPIMEAFRGGRTTCVLLRDGEDNRTRDIRVWASFSSGSDETAMSVKLAAFVAPGESEFNTKGFFPSKRLCEWSGLWQPSENEGSRSGTVTDLSFHPDKHTLPLDEACSTDFSGFAEYDARKRELRWYGANRILGVVWLGQRPEVSSSNCHGCEPGRYSNAVSGASSCEAICKPGTFQPSSALLYERREVLLDAQSMQRNKNESGQTTIPNLEASMRGVLGGVSSSANASRVTDELDGVAAFHFMTEADFVEIPALGIGPCSLPHPSLQDPKFEKMISSEIRLGFNYSEYFLESTSLLVSRRSWLGRVGAIMKHAEACAEQLSVEMWVYLHDPVSRTNNTTETNGGDSDDSGDAENADGDYDDGESDFVLRHIAGRRRRRILNSKIAGIRNPLGMAPRTVSVSPEDLNLEIPTAFDSDDMALNKQQLQKDCDYYIYDDCDGGPEDFKQQDSTFIKRWTHVVATWDATIENHDSVEGEAYWQRGEALLYVNGRLHRRKEGAHNAFSPPSLFLGGGTAKPGRFTPISVARVAVWRDRILSPSDVAALASELLGPTNDAPPSPLGSTCIDCPPGTYMSAIGGAQCSPCKENHFSAYFGSRECEECPHGRFTTYLGRSHCEDCTRFTTNFRDIWRCSCNAWLYYVFTGFAACFALITVGLFCTVDNRRTESQKAHMLCFGVLPSLLVMISLSLLAAFLLESTHCDKGDNRYKASIWICSIATVLASRWVVLPAKRLIKRFYRRTVGRYVEARRRTLTQELATLRSHRFSMHQEHMSSYNCTICSSEPTSEGLRKHAESLREPLSEAETRGDGLIQHPIAWGEGGRADGAGGEFGGVGVGDIELHEEGQGNTQVPTIRADALNRPCGHMFLCWPCATEYRGKFGNICNSCDQPSIIFQVQFERPSVRERRSSNLLQDLETKREGELSRLKDIRLEIRKEKIKTQLSLERHESTLCSGCKVQRADAIHEPCGHCVLCWDCAQKRYSPLGAAAEADPCLSRGGIEGGETLEGPCALCSVSSTICQIRTSHTCRVCFDEVEVSYLYCVGRCGHLLCTACCTTYVRSALGNVATQIHADGMRCPLRPFGCDQHLVVENFKSLVGRKVQSDMEGDATPITGEELKRLERFIYEAGIPHDQRFYCCNEKCARMFRVEPHFADERSVRGMQRPKVTCPFCKLSSCARCKILFHGAIDCDEVEKMANADDEDKRNGQSIALIKSTSKACPKCGYRITHYHGHACHHIAPGTGCLNCGQHFCYSCLRKGTRCSSCSVYCRSDNIKSYLVAEPVPHDKRCGCPICPDCRPGKACALCDGSCVVCKGIVPPGPSTASNNLNSSVLCQS